MRGRPSLAARFVTAIVALAALAGCATRGAPVPTFPESLLLTDYTTWFAADVAGNRELVHAILTQLDSELAGVADRTTRIVGGARVLPGSPAEFSAVATGDFPRRGVELALRRDESFERLTTQIAGRRAVYFNQTDAELQLALPAHDLLYASTGRVIEMLQPRPPAELAMEPQVYRALRRVGTETGPDALVVFHDPGRGALEAIGVDPGALPLESISLTVTSVPETGGLELGGALGLRSERDAALFGRVGRLFVIVFVRALGLEAENLRESVRVESRGAQVVFSGIPLGRDELVAAIRRVAGEP